MTLQSNGSELLDAAMGTTSCLEKLLRLRLARWLPISAISCTALPLLLHILDVEILSSSQSTHSHNANFNKHRLEVLRKAMETYEFQYEGTNWINGAIKRIVGLKSVAPALDPPKADGSCQLRSANVNGWIRMLTFQPGRYLHLAFAIDLTMSRGRLPDKDSLWNLRKFVVHEIPADTIRLDEKSADEFSEPEDACSALLAGEGDQDTTSNLPESAVTQAKNAFIHLEDGRDVHCADLLEIQEIGETQATTWLTESFETIADPGSWAGGELRSQEILGGEGLDVLSELLDGSINVG